MRQGGKLVLLAMFLCLPLACEQSSNSPRLNFADVLPEDWQHVHTYRLDTNHDGDKEWVVLYRFDLPTETEQRDGPIAAVVYQPDDRRPPCIIPYELYPPNRDYLCEDDCKPAMEDVLSGHSGDELIVRDRNNGETIRVAIFRWNPAEGENGEYESLGHFSGRHIEVARDKVTVDQRLPGRAQLAMRYTYLPRDNETYYQQSDKSALVMYNKYELVFYQGEPEDVMLSPYPEKIVLAFYNHYTDDEKASEYFTEEGWGQLDQCAAGRCGCASARDEIADVRVINLQPVEEIFGQEPCHQCEDHSLDQATVLVTVICEQKNGEESDQTTLHWRLIREDDRWKLNEMKPAEGEERGEQ